MSKRYNIKPDVVAVLKDISEIKFVSAEYPNTWADMPTAIYTTRAKPHQSDVSKEEALTEWTIKIDLYDNKSLTVLQAKIIEDLKSIGFQNIETNDGNINKTLKRSIMTFRGVVDNRTLLVYQ